MADATRRGFLLRALGSLLALGVAGISRVKARDTTHCPFPAPYSHCEVCGDPATAVVSDFVVLKPNVDEQGQQYLTLKLHGRHAFCADHRRPERYYNSAGDVVDPSDESERLGSQT